jgi:hypothetical protein
MVKQTRLIVTLQCNVCLAEQRYVCVCFGFKTFFYVVRHLDSIASYLPTGLYLGFFRSWSSLYLPTSYSSVFLVLSFVSASTSMLFWVIFRWIKIYVGNWCKQCVCEKCSHWGRFYSEYEDFRTSRQYHSINAPNPLYHSSKTKKININLKLTASLNITPTDRPEFFFPQQTHCANGPYLLSPGVSVTIPMEDPRLELDRS